VSKASVSFKTPPRKAPILHRVKVGIGPPAAVPDIDTLRRSGDPEQTRPLAEAL
jgi:hypothetical protein